MPERVAADTRARLLAAAERLLLTERYDEMSVRPIRAAAGRNPAAVHYHFGSEDAVVAALREEPPSLWEQRLSVVADAGCSVGETVAAVLAPFVWLADDPVGRSNLGLPARFVLGWRLWYGATAVAPDDVLVRKSISSSVASASGVRPSNVAALITLLRNVKGPSSTGAKTSGTSVPVISSTVMHHGVRSRKYFRSRLVGDSG
ncbi:TetR family transcriptional regulator [Nocardia sp. CT2-14]|uniref:TetR family transcriptional regulator n=1 Tax=Nocardia aurantiaca TaxID=2675850 RepID=A0A6I3L4I7_9NOCA|nr:TetR family transcriptional regulator [Nocardia aurantiaca]